MAKSIVQLVLTIRNPVAFVKNYVRIHIIFQDNEISKSGFDKEGQTYETLWNAKARDR